MTILVPRGKGQKQRLVPLSQQLLIELRLWWRQHRDPAWLFPGGRPGCPLSASTVQRSFRAAVRRVGLKKGASTHSLRHTFATELLEADINLLTIQRILGHASVTTTARYTHVRRDSLQGARQVLDLLPLEQLRGEHSGRTPPARRRRRRKSAKSSVATAPRCWPVSASD